MSQKIICPNCKTQIDLEQIAEEKYKNMLEKQEKELKEEMNTKAIKWAEEKAKKLFEEKAKNDSIEIEDMKERLKKAEEDRQESKKRELEFIKKQRELEDKEKNFELEIEKKLLFEKKKIEEKISEELNEKNKKEIDEKMLKIQEEFRKKELENFKREEQMKKTIDELKRKSEQWSQQIQWDISEDDLKNSLILAFPFDSIVDVPTWIKWADLIQNVRNNFGQNVWIIVWESKNTKSFEKDWIMKLKEDKLKINWNIAILVSQVLPKDIKNFGIIDDIMVCSPEFAIPVAWLLRDKIISMGKLQKSLEWKDIKMEMLYSYLTSEEFGSKIMMMIDVFSNLKSWIDNERRAMEKNWKKREKDLERATFAITWIYWELESLMGQNLIWSEKLSLESNIDED